jgi:hypothetical protein
MRSSRLAQFILLSVVALAVALYVLGVFSSKPPQESTIVHDFNARRPVYEQVRLMLIQDKDVAEVASWGVRAAGSAASNIPSAAGISTQRYQAYLSLIKEAGAIAVAKEKEPPEVRFLVWRSGFAGDTRHIVVSWLDHEPPNRVATLGAFYSTPEPRSPAYVRIDGNWYLWADW